MLTNETVVNKLISYVNEVSLSYEEWVEIDRVISRKRLDAFIKRTSGCFSLENAIRTAQIKDKVSYRTAVARLKLSKPTWLQDALLVKGQYYIPHKHWDAFNDWVDKYLPRDAKLEFK